MRRRIAQRRLAFAFLIRLAPLAGSLLAGGCALPGARDLAPEAGPARESRDAEARRRRWAERARLALASDRGAATLRYGIDWFAVPGTSALHGMPVAFAGLANDLLDSIPAAAAGQALVVVLPSTPHDEMMNAAARVRAVAEQARAGAVLFVLAPQFDAPTVRRAADEIEAAADGLGTLAGDDAGVPAIFVRHDALVTAAAATRYDVAAMVRDALLARVGVVPLPTLRVDESLVLPALAPPWVARGGRRS